MTKHQSSRSLVRRILLSTVMMGTALAAALTPSMASAQCSTPASTEHALAAASSVFVGTVTETSDDSRVALMQVISVWKGRDLPGRVEVRGTTEANAPSSSTDRRFEQGKTYLVIPENSRPPFLATACSATVAFAGAPNLVPRSYQDAVGATTGRAAVGASGGDGGEAALVSSILPMLGIAVLIAGVWALIARHRANNPEPKQVGEPERRPRRLKRRNLARDAATSQQTVAKKLVKKNKRRWKTVRRRQDRQLASSSRKASGSTDTS